MGIPLSELEKLQSVPSVIKRHERMIDDLNETAETYKDYKGSEQLMEQIQQYKAEYDARIEELKAFRREVVGKISKLPTQQRDVLLLRYDAGMIWDDIAAALVVSVRWVYRIRGLAIDQ